MDTQRLKSILESLIFVSDEPIPLNKLAQLAEADDKKALKETLDEMKGDYESRGAGVELTEVAGGYQFRTAKNNARWVSKLFEERPQRLTRASLETLAIVAYRQPITRQDAENIRGVDSGGVLKTLLERNLVRIVGRQDAPGRPVLYATTQEFLEFFGLKSLTDMPPLRDIAELGDAAEELIAEYAQREGAAEAGIPLDPQPQESSQQAEATEPGSETEAKPEPQSEPESEPESENPDDDRPAIDYDSDDEPPNPLDEDEDEEHEDDPEDEEK